MNLAKQVTLSDNSGASELRLSYALSQNKFVLTFLACTILKHSCYVIIFCKQHDVDIYE